MQIDFHHAVTYVVARYSGFTHAEAEIVSYSAQYVDNASNYGVVHFSNEAMYRRIASAHGMIDHHNLSHVKNHTVWIPFHFLPGNGGLPAGQNPTGDFIEKIICKPNSPIAQDMVQACIEDINKPYALHRLGITAHVFVDTWAHQQFAGINNPVNYVEQLDGPAPKESQPFWRKAWHWTKAIFQGAIPPLGHGQALTNPDLPFAEWSYTNGLGHKITHKNLDNFTDAADELCKVFKSYRSKTFDLNINGLTTDQKDLLRDKLKNTRSHDEEERHAAWLKAIADDDFGFGAENLSYIPKGRGSWKHKALGTEAEKDHEDDRPEFTTAFLTSDWKMFHDAAKEHRLTVVDDILPKYGICAA